MENENLLNLVIALVIGVILTGAVIMPVISDAQETLGTPATLDNTSATNGFTYEIWKGEDITLAYTVTDNVYTVNDEPVSLLEGFRILVASNEFSVRTGTEGNTIITYCMSLEHSTQYAKTNWTFEVVNGEYTATVGTFELSGSVDWLVYATDDGTSGLVQVNDPSNFYTSKANDVIVLGNIYTTGENDTYYAYYNGQLSVAEAYKDVSSAEIITNIADGYTDIYDTTVSIKVGDETFTPYYILAPQTIKGHAASGTSYELLGVLPIFVVLGFVLAAAGAIIIKDRD